MSKLKNEKVQKEFYYLVESNLNGEEVVYKQ